MRFVVVLSPEHKGVYSYDPDNGSTSAVAVASDNSVRPLPWSLDECAQNGLDECAQNLPYVCPDYGVDMNWVQPRVLR